MPKIQFPPGRTHDLACLGRLAVDLYSLQFGARLEDARSLAMYLGGSSANLAFGVARLGGKSAMISRVGDEQMGRFLTETLQAEGCDTSQVQVDPERLTALVLLGLKDRDTFPLLFVRENCADMALDASAIDENFVAQCRALAITGTHLSTDGTRLAAHKALAAARHSGTTTVLDIDYRPVLWGLTGRGAGESRFVDNAGVTRQLQASSSLFFEVFRKYDPGNRLLGQAEEEVLSQELEITRLRSAMKRMRKLRLDFVELAVPSPFSLPLMVERFREQLSTEKLAARLARIVADAEAALVGPAPAAKLTVGPRKLRQNRLAPAPRAGKDYTAP